MKIDLGNFGYQQREAVNAQVDRGDPTVQARAMQQVAQSQLQADTQANQAWGQVGKSAMELGNNLHEIVAERARLDSANEVQKYRAAATQWLSDTSNRAASGELKSQDIMAAAQKFNETYKTAEISGLGYLGQKRLDDAMLEARNQLLGRATDLKDNQEKVELSNSLEQNAQLNNKNGFDAGLHPDQISAYYDNPGIVANANRVYGGNAFKWLSAQKESAFDDWTVAALGRSKDNRNALASLRAKLNDPNDPDTHGLSSDKRLRYSMQAGNQIDSLDAKALAQRNAAINAARLAEERGRNIMEQAEKVQDSGATLSPQFQAAVLQATQGTTYEKAARALPQRELAVQQFRALDQADRDALITAGTILNSSRRDASGKLVDAAGKPVSIPKLSPAAMSLLHVNPNGGTDPKSLASFEAMRRANEADKDMLHNDMIQHAQLTTQQQLAPLQYDLLTAKGSPAQVAQNVQNFIKQADIPTRLGMRDAALKSDRSATDSIWTGNEAQPLMAIMNNPDVPAQNKQIIKQELYRVGGAAALKSLGADELDVAGAHFAINYPHDTRGAEVQGLKNYLAKGDGTGKNHISGPSDDQMMVVLNDMYGESISQADKLRIAQSLSPLVAYRRIQSGRSGTDKHTPRDIRDVAEDYVGKPVDYNGNIIVMPKVTATNPGSDFDMVDSRVRYALTGLPNGDAIYAQIKNGNLRLQATGANSFILRQPGPNGDIYTDPQTHRPIRIDWSN